MRVPPGRNTFQLVHKLTHNDSVEKSWLCPLFFFTLCGKQADIPYFYFFLQRFDGYLTTPTVGLELGVLSLF